MQVEVFGITGDLLTSWETESPLEDLVSHTEWIPHEKRFRLDGVIVRDALDLLKISKFNARSRLAVYLFPRGPLFTLPGLLLLGLTAVTGLIKLVFFRPQQQRQQEIIRDDVDRSPINRYKGRVNVSRPQARIPDIYGQHRVYPDLIAPEFWEYVGRSQRISYLMVVGLGTYQINDSRLGDTPISLVIGITKLLVHRPGERLEFFNQVVRNVDNLQSTELRLNQNVGFFTLRGDQQIDIWFDIEFPNGLYVQDLRDGDILPGVVKWQVQILNETGTFNRTVDYRFDGDSEQSLIYTFKVSQKIGLLPPDTYRFRITNTFDQNTEIGDDFRLIGTMNLIRVGSVERLERVVYPDVTTIEVEIDTSNFNQDQLNKRLNFLVTRQLRRYTGGFTMSANISPTRLMADALVEIATGPKGGNYADNQLDLPGLYEIQNKLISIGEGTFDAVIDQRRSVDSELQLVANSGRTQIFRYGNRLFFSRDEQKTFPSTLINGRNKIESEERVFNFLNSDDPDAVEVTWINPELDYRPAQELYPPNSSQLNVERIELLGVTSQLAAYRRAQFEFLAIQRRRDSLKVKTTSEGRLLGLLDWVRVSDGIQELTGDGECDITGNLLELDHNLPLGVGDSVALRSGTGDYVGTFSVIEVVSNRSCKVNPTPIVSALPDDAQVKYLYAVRNNSSDITDWSVSRVRPDEGIGAWDVELIPYDPTIFNVDLLQLGESV